MCGAVVVGHEVGTIEGLLAVIIHPQPPLSTAPVMREWAYIIVDSRTH